LSIDKNRKKAGGRSQIIKIKHMHRLRVHHRRRDRHLLKMKGGVWEGHGAGGVKNKEAEIRNRTAAIRQEGRRPEKAVKFQG